MIELNNSKEISEDQKNKYKAVPAIGNSSSNQESDNNQNINLTTGELNLIDKHEGYSYFCKTRIFTRSPCCFFIFIFYIVTVFALFLVLM